MEKNEKYINTQAVYKELGTKYLKILNGVEIKEINDFIDLLPAGARILEVGCAGARDTKIFCEHGLEVTGIDLENKFLQFCRKRVSGAKFVKMNVLDLRFKDNYFDAIWAFAVLLHLEKKDLPKALNNCRHKLKPGGKIFIAVKRGRGEEYISEKLSEDKKRFYSFYLKYELEQYLKNSNFRILSSQVVVDELARSSTQWLYVIAEKK